MRAPIFLFSLALLTRVSAAEGELTLDQVLEDVRAHHPQIRAAGALTAAAHERIAQAGAWEDPVAGLELQRMNNNSRPLSYDAAELQFSQKIPLSGNRERRRALARAEATVAAAGGRSQEFMLVAAAREAFFLLLRARAQLALTRETDRLLAHTADLVRSRLAAGTADPAALFAAESERARLQERVLLLDREIADASATLNTLRNLPPQTPLGPLATPAFATPFASLEEAQAQAIAHRPELREADARITATVRAQDLADRAWRPDPEVMLKARHFDGTGKIVNDYDTAVAISLPWVNDAKYRSAQREAARRHEAAELDAAVLRSKTAAEVRDMWQRLDTARRNADLYRDRLLPLSRQAADQARAGLLTGKASVTDLVTAQRALVDVQTNLASHLADSHRYAAMLQTLAGATDHP
ncbi:MAG: hypothetical protein EXS32_14755 [Opitutus sp.]|nr:hypothetical protein [Opitutus sp.]